jgi:hypothetical protein
MALDFPSSGLTVGQLFPATATPGVPQWMWDGSAWVTPVGAGGNFMSAAKIQRFAASGTYTPTVGMAFCIVECVGGGGGGGGTSGTSASIALAAGGGGAGSYARKLLTSVQVGASQTVTIGGGGASGAAGTDTSFGGLCIGKGGSGGVTGAGVATTGGGVGGVAGTGDVTIPGGSGCTGHYQGGTVNSNIPGGTGGSSAFGGGGAGGTAIAGGNVSNGFAGTCYGSGGGGGVSELTTGAATGGAGAPGICIVTEYGNWAQPAAVIRGQLHGMTLSTAGSSTTFTVQPGIACDSTFVDMMTLTAVMNKTTGGFAAGSGNGALDTGTIANSTWYHAYVIKNQATGAVDVLVSLSATAPTMPSGFNLFRRIGSMRVDTSGNWRLFHQLGDEFLWDVRNLDVNAVAISTTATTPTLTVPTGVQVNALCTARFDSTSAASVTLFTSPDESDQAPGGALATVVYYVTPASAVVGQLNIRTDTSSRIRMRSNGTGATANVYTYGWIDRRGRDA